MAVAQSDNQELEFQSQGLAEKETKASKKKIIFDLLANSYVCWALIAFLCLDLFLLLSWNRLKLDHYASANRSMVWWAVDDFRKQKKPPELVLLGSSLLMHVLHGGDAEYLQMPQNEVLHHKAVMLEDLIARKTGLKVNTFAFALAGEMASDAYALTTTLLKDEKKPKVIIYNIAPRDFIDNTLGNPGASEIFKYMSRLGGVKDVGWQARGGIWEKLEYGLEHFSSVYNHRQYFVYLQQKYANSILKPLGFKPSQEVHTPFELRRLALFELPEDMGTNERIASPNLKDSFVDNSDEYLKRYQPFKMKNFLVQIDYLDKLFAYCREQGIELVLVNMPLTSQNINLLAPGSYELYKSKVTELAGKYGGRFIDLQNGDSFEENLFRDTAHMNGKGGLRFFHLLSEKLTDGSKLAIGQKQNWQ